MLQKMLRRLRRKHRVSSQIFGTANRPRLSVFRSSQYIYAQLIDDENHSTLVSASDIKETSGTKTEKALAVGKSLATAAKSLKIENVVFDRGGFLYHGRVRALADGARENGLIF